MFLRKRDLEHGHNSLVSVFLRKLEYYQGIMLLTTNRVSDFDDAIQSRIHLGLKYETLGVDTRRRIWDSFLKKAIAAEVNTVYNTEELDDLEKHELNGRQVSSFFIEALSRRVLMLISYFRSRMSSEQPMPWRSRKGL
jgi:hypothetical protein